MAMNLVSPFRFSSGGGADVTTTFGNLTREGAGGVAVTGTSISSGDASGHWQISGGEISPSATGEDSLTGSYSMTLNDGQTVDITLQANKASVASTAELGAAWTAVPASTATGILVRAGDYSASAQISLASKSFTSQFTIEPHDTFTPAATPDANTYGVTLPGLLLGNATQNVRCYGLKFYETLAGVAAETSGVVEVTDGGTAANITIEACEVHSRSFEDAYDNAIFADSTGFSSYASQSAFFTALDACRGIRLRDVNNARVLDCYIHDVTRGISMDSLGIDGGNRSLIDGNYIKNVISNFTTAGGETNGLDIWNNRMIDCWGSDGEVPSNPLHSAVGLSFDSPATGAFQNVTVKGNLGHVGEARKRYTIAQGDSYTVVSAATGMKFNDPNNTYSYQNITIAHNLIVSHGLCVEISGGQNIDIYNNTLADENYTSDGTPSYYFQGAENLRAWNNIGPDWDIGANDGGTENGAVMVTTADTAQQYGNYDAGGDGGPLGFASVFEGDGASGFNFPTFANLDDYYTPVTGNFALTATEKKGALGTGYWDGSTDTAPAFSAPVSTETPSTPTTTVWDGSDYLTRGGGLTGASDGREVTLAWQGELAAAQDGVGGYFIQATGLRVAARYLGTGRIRFYIEDTGGLILQGDTPEIAIDSTTGQHAWAFSANLTNGRALFALNGTPFPIPLGVSVTSLADIDWTTSEWAINADVAGSNTIECDFEAVLISDTFIDLDTSAGLEQLFASDGLFKDWGAAGVNINGGSELVVIQGENASALNGGTANSGTGGAFSMTGAVADSGADVTAPTISSSDPADNSTDHPVGDNIVITFDENVAFGTGNIVLRENNGGWSDLETFSVTADVGTGAGEVSISGAVLTINPTSDLTASREYAIRIAATAIDDTSGNSFAGIADDTTLSFETPAAAGGITVFEQASVAGESGTDETYNFVGSLLEDDIVVLVHSADSYAGAGIPANTGYTREINDVSDLPALAVEWKRQGATPDTSVTITAGAIGSPGRDIASHIFVLRGVDATTAIDVTVPAVTTESSNNSITPPAITTANNGSLVLVVGAMDDQGPSTVSSYPSGYANTASQGTSGAVGGSTLVGVATKIVTTAGLETPGAFTFPVSDAIVGATIAFRAA